jgi:hypothetical protein
MVAGEQAADDRRLASRAQRGPLAGAGHVFDHAGPLHQQVVQRIIDAIQLGPQRRQGARLGVPPAIRRRGCIAAVLLRDGRVGHLEGAGHERRTLELGRGLCNGAGSDSP